MNAERLLILAEHLETGKLGHERFNFIWFNGGSEFDARGCGTLGCAIGECPIVWPEDWEFRETWPVLIGHPMRNAPFQSAADWFAIPLRDATALFSPNHARNWATDKLLSPGATKGEVAFNIRQYVAFNLEQSERKDRGRG